MLIERIRNGPSEFRESTSDLLLAQSCVRQIESHHAAFRSRTSWLGRVDHETTRRVFLDIRTGLEDLQRELEGHAAQHAVGRSLDNAVAERQKVLREKLQFHFNKLSILYQSFSLAQGTRMAETLREAL